MAPLNRLTDTPRRPGRPSAGPAVRVVLSMRPEEKDSLLHLANGRQISGYILDCVAYAEAHRPAPRASRPVSSVYTAIRLTDAPRQPIVQVVRHTYPDGRWTERYTGVEYADWPTAGDDCAALNHQPSREDAPRATPAPGGALTPQDGGTD